MSYIYLATPYTHPDLEVMHQRYLNALDCLNYLLGNRIWTYSPIVHCHDVATVHTLPTDAQFWYDYNMAMLEAASGLYILTIDGWMESKGIANERNFARRQLLPVTYVHKHPTEGFQVDA